MANTDLRRQLSEIAQQFVDNVVRAITSVPLAEIASLGGGGRGGARGVVAGGARGRGRRGGGVVVAGGRRGAGDERGGGGGRRTLVRRPADEIQRLRAAILKTLRGAPGPVGASEIARQIGGDVKAAQIAFPMAKLREQGLVHKEGERTQAVYTLTDRGRAAFEGGDAGSRGEGKRRGGGGGGGGAKRGGGKGARKASGAKRGGKK